MWYNLTMEKLNSLANGQWTLNKVQINTVSSRDTSMVDPETDPKYIHIASKVLPNGLTYKQFKVKNSKYNTKVHVMYEKNNPEPISMLNTADTEDPGTGKMYRNAANWSATVPEHQKKGIGQQLYVAALMHLGEMHSDDNQSLHAYKLWNNLLAVPGLSVNLSKPGDSSNRHKASLDPKTAIDMAKVFHPVKLY